MNKMSPFINSPINPVEKLTNLELELRLKDLASKERKLLHVILEHIKEFENRKLYLARAYSSVFEYLVKELGYSNSAAMRRIEAARLLRDVPVVAQKIQEGTLNLSQIGELSRALKEKEKITGNKISKEVKADLVFSISGKTTQETQKELAVALDIPVQDFEKQKVQQDQSLRIEITLSKGQLDKLQQCKDLAAHLLMQNFNNQASWATLFEILADQYLNKKKMNLKPKARIEAPPMAIEAISMRIGTLGKKAETPSKIVRNHSRALKKAAANSLNIISMNGSGSDISSDSDSSSNFCTSTRARPSKSSIVSSSDLSIESSADSSVSTPNPIADAAIHNRIYKKVTPLLKRTVLLRDGCCQYLDPATGKRCHSKFGLEVDHKTSQWAGGQHTLINLRTLCRKHNSYKYSLESGIRNSTCVSFNLPAY
jgi:hypothetical protein